MIRPAALLLAVATHLALNAPAHPAQHVAPSAAFVAQLRREEVHRAVWKRIIALGKEAVPELKRLVTGQEDLARARAALLLYRLGETSALDDLSALLESKDEAARREAAGALLSFIGCPLDFAPAASEGQRAKAVARWQAWWKANRKDVLATPPMSRLYGRVLTVDPSADLVAISLAARHGATKRMQLVVVRGAQIVCSLELVLPGKTSSIARIVQFSARVPPRVGDLAFFIRR